MWIPKYCIRISPQILTTPPQLRLQADAVSDPLSVRESATRFLILTRVYVQLLVIGLSTRRRVLGLRAYL